MCVETGGVRKDRGCVCVCVCVDGGVCVWRDWGVVVEGVEGGCGAKNGCVLGAVGNR